MIEKPDFKSLLSKASTNPILREVGEVLFYGDLHCTDRTSSIHVDYEEDSIYVLQKILEDVETRKPKAVVLAGDLVGLNKDKNVKSIHFKAYMHVVFKRIYDIVEGNFYVTLGNHDEGTTLTDTQYFLMTGAIRNVDFFDIGNMRVHLINYGEEHREVSIREGAFNVAVMHYELHVGRETSWFFNSSKSVELSSLVNLKGMDLILSGHIHKPSPYPIKTSIGDKAVTLLYLGSPTRSRATDEYSFVHVVSLESSDVDVRYTQLKWELPEGRFKKDVIETELEGVLAELEMLNTPDNFVTERQQNLADALSGLADYGLLGGRQDFRACLEAIGVMDKEALELITNTLDTVAEKNNGAKLSWI